ncbi:uncharacterized protein LOC130443779 [Diorhabda sublineata]|uniref:uncharacterized protein LOC130443779 n=1 Tax=Diorhabda sublineata TaxID=1163346 RepID=UPI0024E0A09D|nr:uncharacterized protein LOC130443779 [Diorhabda sublineata]
MNGNLSPIAKNRKHKEEMKEQIVAQVHKTVISTNNSDDYQNSEPESNRTYTKYEDNNENISLHTPSREISVDGESQINSKILSLIETEMKRDINRHSHFTDSRPQSLSFYEDEKMPEELSGNLELLSPEERKHYKKRKEYLQMDTDEMNAYNSLQVAHSGRDPDDIMTSSLKKSKSKKKRHIESEMGMGDSREMMIPKEKKKSKKKRRDVSPANSSNTKRKHKKREEDYDLRNDIAVALEELQDDVFETTPEFNSKPDKMKKSPRKSDKLYIQKKTKFEVTPRSKSALLHRQLSIDNVDDNFGKKCAVYPLEISICFQKWWLRFSTLCHGLLGGLGLGHWLYIICNFNQQDTSFLIHYAYYSDIYVGMFFALCVLCLVSVFDRIDTAHFEKNCLKECWNQKRISVIVLLYSVCLIIHLATFKFDNQFATLAYQTFNETLVNNITKSDVSTWNHLSLWRSLLAFTAWILVGLGPTNDLLYQHLKNLETYLPTK